MKRKICVRSMVLGASIMLIGLAVGAIVSPPLVAQRNGVFGEIQCTKLTVVDNMGKPAVELAGTEGLGNSVFIYNKQGNSAIGLLSHEDLGNNVSIYNKQGETAVELASTEDLGNSVSIYNKQGRIAVLLNNSVSVVNQGRTAVLLHNTVYGGRVDVFNNQSQNRATVSVNEYGNGAVSTWDKNGYRQ